MPVAREVREKMEQRHRGQKFPGIYIYIYISICISYTEILSEIMTLQVVGYIGIGNVQRYLAHFLKVCWSIVGIG